MTVFKAKTSLAFSNIWQKRDKDRTLAISNLKYIYQLKFEIHTENSSYLMFA